MQHAVTAADVMLQKVPTLSTDAPWRDAVPPLLKDAHVALPIVDQISRVVGILTHTDLAVRLSGMEHAELRAVLDCAVLTRSFRTVMRWHDSEAWSSDVTVARLMTTPAVTVQAQMSLETVATILFTHDIAQVPVTDGAKRLVGIIRRQEMIAAFAGNWQVPCRDTPRMRATGDFPARDGALERHAEISRSPKPSPVLR